MGDSGFRQLQATERAVCHAVRAGTWPPRPGAGAKSLALTRGSDECVGVLTRDNSNTPGLDCDLPTIGQPLKGND
eukprot:9289334-Alexandrium_andersonii.AAC.1